MKYSSLCLLWALAGSASAFTPVARPRTQSTFTELAASKPSESETQKLYAPTMVTPAAVATSAALALLLSATPVDAATTTAPVVVPPEKQALLSAQQSVVTQTKRLSDLSAAIKAENIVDKQAAAAAKKAAASAARAQTNYEREQTYLAGLPTGTPGISVQAQKTKVGA